MRPVVVDVARKLTRETEIGGWRLPAGTLVLPAIAVLHMRPDLYEAPEEFRPERWLDGDVGVVRLDPVRRRRAALHRRLVRPDGDAHRAARGAAAGAAARAEQPARARRGPARDRGPGPRRPRARGSAPSRRAGGGTRRRPRRHAPASRTRRARSPSDVTTDSSPGAGSASTSAAMSSSAAFATAPGGEHDADAVAVELERLPVEHHRHVVSPARRELAEVGHQPAHRARAVAPPAGRPRSDHVHAVDDPAGHFRRRRNSRMRSHEQEPRAELQGQPQTGALVARRVGDCAEHDRGAEEHNERPQDRVPVHRAARYPWVVSARVSDRPVLAGVLGAFVIAFSAILVRLVGGVAVDRRVLPMLLGAPGAVAARPARGAPVRAAHAPRPAAAVGRGRDVRRGSHVLAPLDRGGRAPASRPCSATSRSCWWGCSRGCSSASAPRTARWSRSRSCSAAWC